MPLNLLIGPPGSGKASRILAAFRRQLDDTALLLVPTATMGEHLRNRFAREGLVFRPRAIGTLSKFLHRYVPDAPLAGAAQLALVLEDVLVSAKLDAFAAVAGQPGFRSSLVRAMEELAAAGCSAARFKASADSPEFAEIYSDVEQVVRARGLYWRYERLALAAQRIGERGLGSVRHVYFAGFYSFTSGETAVIESIAQHADILVSLPEWSGSHRCLQRLRASAAQVEILHETQPPPIEQILVRPSTPEQEAAEISRRILGEVNNGRAFREIGVILRSEHPFAGTLHAALARFGIPSRFYFSQPLATDPAVRYLSAVVESMLNGWEHESLLAALRTEGSPFAHTRAGDVLEHEIIKRLPGSGLERIREIAGDRRKTFLDSLTALDSWRTLRLRPAAWAKRFASVCSLYSAPDMEDGVTETFTGIWRSRAAAIEAFARTAGEAAKALAPDAPLSCEEFWHAVRTALTETSLRIPDHRSNVVHVMDAFEARQWKLPVVFLPNLLEKHFPRYHAQDSILPDAVRRTLQQAGYEVRTAAERQQDEAFLFDLACSRAGSRLVLSAPRINEKGGDTLASFFLQKVATVAEPCVAVRPAPARSAMVVQPSPILRDDLLQVIGQRTAAIRVTAIDSYLRCPFVFFGRTLLRILEPPDRPEDRLSVLLQGQVAHNVLERLGKREGDLEQLVSEELARACTEAHVPLGYRAEAIRLEILTNLSQYVRQSVLPTAPRAEFEQKFELQFDAATLLRGRIDRLDFYPAGAVVVDYKYSGKPRIESIIEEHRAGSAVQTGLYLLSLESGGQHAPAGMLYAGLRGDISIRGWAGEVPGYADIQLEEDPLADMIERARTVTKNVLASVRSGKLQPQPSSDKVCRYCDYAHACRIESQSGAGFSLTRGSQPRILQAPDSWPCGGERQAKAPAPRPGGAA